MEPVQREAEFSGAESTSGFPAGAESPPRPFPERSWEGRNRDYFGGFNSPRFSARRNENGESRLVRNDTWSCVVVVLTFWSFVCLTLVLGVYGTSNLRLGPYSSILIKPSPLFVESIKVEELDADNGVMLYGFFGTPPLDVVRKWSEIHTVSLPPNTHKEWVYYFNEGSQVNISYSVNSPRSSCLVLVITEGNDGLVQWLGDPSYPSSAISWHSIRGNGLIQQEASKSSMYFIAVGNLNSEVVDVEVNITIGALLYNTSNHYYKCSPAQGRCILKLVLSGKDAAVLSSPGQNSATGTKRWHVKVTYGPRWITYLVGISVMTAAFLLLNRLRCIHQNGNIDHSRATGSERTALLSHKDDDASSWCSSLDSVSQDEEDIEYVKAAGSLEGKPVREGEINNSTRRLCAICFDAPRNCFFIPCGHCVACFDCATRMAETAGTCPVCRRSMKKVRKIFTV